MEEGIWTKEIEKKDGECSIYKAKSDGHMFSIKIPSHSSLLDISVSNQENPKKVEVNLRWYMDKKEFYEPLFGEFASDRKEEFKKNLFMYRETILKLGEEHPERKQVLSDIIAELEKDPTKYLK